jgi:hypothetical protein
MLLTDKLWLGTGAGLLGAGLYRHSHPRDREDLGDTLTKGVLLGGTAALAGPSLLRTFGPGTFRTGKSLTQSYLSSMSAQYARLSAKGVNPLTAAYRSYGRLPVMAGLGAGVGALLDSDDPMQGALYGAGAGAALNIALHSTRAWNKVSRSVFTIGPGGLKIGNKTIAAGLKTAKEHEFIKPGKWGIIAGLSALAFAGGSIMSANTPVAEATYNPTEGYDEYAPGTAPDHGLRDRLNAMNATGDIVFGAHRRR